MSASNDLKELRRSTVVSTFGPGSVVDFRADGGAVSGIAAGLEEWDHSFPLGGGSRNPQLTRETRLQKKLGVKWFRSPPVIDDRRDKSNPDTRRLVAVRFPRWLQCPGCDTIKPERKWNHEPGSAARYCATCTGKSGGDNKVFVFPVRFIMACKDGHVDEFPWDWWVQHKPGCRVRELKKRSAEKGKGEDYRHPGLKLRARGPGLAGLILSCPKCHASRSMDGVFSKGTWENGPKCRGHRPWLANGTESCGKGQVAVQRGASNLYFPVLESALSIPPWSDQLQEALGTWWNSLVSLDDPSDLEGFIRYNKADLEPVLDERGMSPAELAAAVRARLTSYENVQTDDLRTEEYRQFMSDPGRERPPDFDFEIRGEDIPEGLELWLSRVVRVVRLREVRAIRGFTRINPPGDPESPDVARLSVKPLHWLPAIEVRGEGIFVALDEARVAGWERQSCVANRAAQCDERHRVDWAERYGGDAEPPDPVTPRYMLCHTLAHVLMRQLTLECGYSSASLQERIYAGTGGEQMAGILVYTATSGSDGTLGGLERQGRIERLQGTLERALRAIEWCSSDPLCITDMMGAIDSYSHSVCHACCLAPETSCEAFNCFLDRALLVGDGTGAGLGFFENMDGAR